jgi:hypothetical protein
MTKAPEEGKIWEWRAFGLLSQRLAGAVRAYPVRMGIEQYAGEDIYLVSPTSDQNVKLRKSSIGWLLKFKLLFATAPQSIELYSETADHVYRFPIGRDQLTEAARLLETKLPDDLRQIDRPSLDQFTQTLAESSPPIVRVQVLKVRSQYQFEGGWIELADCIFPRHRAQTISIQSPDLETVREMLDQLGPGDELEAMNYVEACRRWM